MKALFLFLIVLMGNCTMAATQATITVAVPPEYKDVTTFYITRPQFVNGVYKVDTIAQGKVANLKATIAWQIEEPCFVNLTWKNQRENVRFIAEAGTLTLSKPGEKWVVNGGKYNDLLINIPQNTPQFLEASRILDGYEKLYSDSFTELEKEAFRIMYYKISSAVRKIEKEYLLELYAKSTDSEKLLILAYSNMFPLEKRDSVLNSLSQNVKSGYTFAYLKEQTANYKQQELNKSTVAVGKRFKDFSTRNVENKECRLGDVVKKNKYTLLEFWASWCGPCRGEIPHLKQCYEEFHAKGFEIFSYSLDNKKENWLKASQKENFGWINTSDLDVWDSPAAKLYFVGGIPANFLIDQNGTIVARDLRGLNLKRKLDELLK